MYTIYILCLLIFISILILLRFFNVKRNYIISIFITFFIFLFVYNLQSNMDAAVFGVKLVIVAIMPTIFPFSAICNLLICYDGIELYSKILGPLICKPLKLSKACSFPLAASFICGYPLGAKYATDTYKLGYIDKEEYERLLNIATNAGPIFILGSIALSILGDIKYGYILLIANYLSIFLIGLFTRKNSTNLSLLKNKSLNSTSSFGTNLKVSIENAVSTTINVGAFVIIFSVIINIIKTSNFISLIFHNIENFLKLTPTTLYNLLLGSIEFTNGAKLIELSSLSMPLKLSIISFILSFSGFSVIAQVSSITSSAKPNMVKYTLYKGIQGLLSFFITLFVSSFLLNTKEVSNLNLNTSLIYYNFYKIYLFIFILLLFTLFIFIIRNKLKKNLHSSKF